MFLQLSLDPLLLQRRLLLLPQLHFHLVTLHLQQQRVVVALSVLDERFVRVDLAVRVERIRLVHFLMVRLRQQSRFLCTTK